LVFIMQLQFVNQDRQQLRRRSPGRRRPDPIRCGAARFP